jgi:hypothetical protein
MKKHGRPHEAAACLCAGCVDFDTFARDKRDRLTPCGCRACEEEERRRLRRDFGLELS